MLKYETPVVYGLIMNMTKDALFLAPKAYLIRIICKGSRDPCFSKPKFQRYLDEYEKYGLYCRRPKKLTRARKVYYERIRQKKIQKYIMENKKKIEQMKRMSQSNQGK